MSFSRLMRRLSSSLLGGLDEIGENGTPIEAEARQMPFESDTGRERSVYERTSVTLPRGSSHNYSSMGFQENESSLPQPPAQNPMLFCKNNVCVHSPTSVSTKIDHCPGYLSIKSHLDDFGGQSLLLTWIPNSQLKSNVFVAEALTSGASPLFTPPPPSRGKFRSRTSSVSSDMAFSEPPPTPSHTFFHRVSSEGLFESIKGIISGPPSRLPSRPESPTNDAFEPESRTVLKVGRAGSNSSDEPSSPEYKNKKSNNNEEFQNLIKDINQFCLDKELSVDAKVEASGAKVNHLAHNGSYHRNDDSIYQLNGNDTDSPVCGRKTSSQFNYDDRVAYSSGIAEERSTREHIVGVISADLTQMRSIRLFYSDERESCGQLVLASCECQYKIFHFHNGGLDRLASTLQSYQNCSEKFQYRETGSGLQFSISSLTLDQSSCHRDEGRYGKLTRDMWNQYVNENGVVENETELCKHVFFGGLDPGIRREVWPYLLHYLPFNSTKTERHEICRAKAQEYHEVQRRRGSMSESAMESFWRNIQTIVDKDVIRTDRNNPFFKGECNPNLQIMRNILLNYAIYNPIIGYMQGMSDLLAPLLVELRNESDAFWCFVGLMHATIFISSPTDDDMDLQLNLVKELVKIFCPRFYQHLDFLGQDALELLFCHRWILLCFKREFLEQDALKIWESCWSKHETDYFHLFVCVAIIKVYGDDVYQKNLAADEILLHFNTLAMHMSVDLVLKVARGLVYQFKTLTSVPCVLQTLYQNADFYTISLPVNVYCIHTNTAGRSKWSAESFNGCPFDKQRITSVKNYLKMSSLQ